jgi:hypothetical protein
MNIICAFVSVNSFFLVNLLSSSKTFGKRFSLLTYQLVAYDRKATQKYLTSQLPFSGSGTVGSQCF